MKKVWLAIAVVLTAVFGVQAEPWKIRAVQLDLARQKETVPFLKSYIEKIADAGYNTLVFYVEGRIKTPSLSFAKDDECYTPDEIRDVVAHAQKFNVDVVPVVSLLGHANLFMRYPEMKVLSEGRANMPGWVGATFCLSKPETRAFLEKYFDEVVQLFPSKYFHVGFDEAWDMGTCELCAPQRKAKGMGPLFTGFVKFAHDLCVRHGKRMWMWDDMYEFFPEELANCPKDVVMCNWKYEPVSAWGIRARFADSMRTDWMSLYRSYGIDALMCGNAFTDNLRTFTAYAKKQPNCLGGVVTQWEMSMYHHGFKFPVVLGAGIWWSKHFDDPAFDFISAGCAKQFPSLSPVERQAVETLVNQGATGYIPRPACRDLANLRGQSRTFLCSADKLAIAVLKQSKLHPGSGDVVAEPLSEAALLDDLVTDSEFCQFNDLFRSVVPMLRSPERTAASVRSAKRQLSAAAPELRRICARRWAQRNAWRGDMRPWEFPPADFGKKYIEELLAVPEAPAADDEWWLVANMNLPDWFGSLDLHVYALCDGSWKKVGFGAWKPGLGDENCFETIIPFKSKTAPTALRIASESGIGITGLNYISCVNRNRRLVPGAILSSSGHVRDERNILIDNLYPVVFGLPDRQRLAFHPDGPQKMVGTLEISLKDSFSHLSATGK